jgi:alkylhydroperoxidase family enzyme|tara:strand:- start:2242 stop:2487 length:246 start_codon:yes stop_codon:yes gene_type:complete
MLDYAVKLTLTPHDITEVDISTLSSSGFDETAILDLCQVVSYYNYVNRLADGLGVELENYWEAEEFTMTREEFDSRLMETE